MAQLSGGLRATEYTYKTDNRQGITTYTLQNRTLTIPRTFQHPQDGAEHDKGFSVYMNVGVKGRKNEEPVNASLKRKKQKLFLKRSNSGDVASKNKKSETGKGYSTLAGPSVQGQIEETQVQVALDNAKPNNAVLDVIQKAKELAYQTGEGETSGVNVEQAMTDGSFTDELKGAIIELKMVPKIDTKTKMEWRDQIDGDVVYRQRSSSSQSMNTYEKRNSGQTFVYSEMQTSTSSTIPGYGTGYDEDTEVELTNAGKNSWSRHVPVNNGSTDQPYIRLSQSSVYSVKDEEDQRGFDVYKPPEKPAERCLSPDTVVENILEDLDDSEVYEENVTLNRIFSVRRDIMRYKHRDVKAEQYDSKIRPPRHSDIGPLRTSDQRKLNGRPVRHSDLGPSRSPDIVQENVYVEAIRPTVEPESMGQQTVEVLVETIGQTHTINEVNEDQSDDDIFDEKVTDSMNVSLEDVLGNVSDTEFEEMTDNAQEKPRASIEVDEAEIKRKGLLSVPKTSRKRHSQDNFEKIIESPQSTITVEWSSDFGSDREEKSMQLLSPYEYVTPNDTSRTSSCEAIIDDAPRSVSSVQTRASCSETSFDEDSDEPAAWQHQDTKNFEELITNTVELTQSINSEYNGRKKRPVSDSVFQSNGTYYMTETVRTSTTSTSSVSNPTQRTSYIEEVVRIPSVPDENTVEFVLGADVTEQEEPLQESIKKMQFDLDVEVDANMQLCSESEGSLGSLLDETTSGGYSGSASGDDSEHLDIEDVRYDALREIMMNKVMEKEIIVNQDESDAIQRGEKPLESDMKVEEVEIVTVREEIIEEKRESFVEIFDKKIEMEKEDEPHVVEMEVNAFKTPENEVKQVEKVEQEVKTTDAQSERRASDERIKIDHQRRQQVENSLKEFKQKMEVLTASNLEQELKDDKVTVKENEKENDKKKGLQVQSRKKGDVGVYHGEKGEKELVISEEIITQEIVLEIKLPRKKKKKDKSAVVKKDCKPVRDLHLRRVTRLTDCDVEIVDGRAIEPKDTSEAIKKKISVGSPSHVEKVPLDESIEQHSHDIRMPLVVEVRDRSGSSGPLSPVSPMKSPSAMSPAGSQSGIHINRADGLNSPGNSELEYIKKESSDSRDANVNVHREETLKVLQVPDSTTSFMLNIKSIVNQLGATMNSDIDSEVKDKVTVTCHANETVQRSPDPDEIESRSTCISKVLVGPDVSLPVVSKKSHQKMIEITSSSVQEAVCNQDHEEEMPSNHGNNTPSDCVYEYEYDACKLSPPLECTQHDDLKAVCRPCAVDVRQPLHTITERTRESIESELDLLLQNIVDTLVHLSDSFLDEATSPQLNDVTDSQPAVSVISSHSPNYQAVRENAANEAISLIREANRERESDNSHLLLQAPLSSSSSEEDLQTDIMDYEDDLDFALGDYKVVYPSGNSTITSSSFRHSPQRHSLPASFQEHHIRSLHSSSEPRLYDFSPQSNSNVIHRSISSHSPLASTEYHSRTRSHGSPRLKMQNITCFGIDVQIPKSSQDGTGEDLQSFDETKFKHMPKMRDIIVHEDPDSSLQAISLTGRVGTQVKEFMLMNISSIEDKIKSKLEKLLKLVDEISHEFHTQEAESDKDLIKYYINAMSKKLMEAVDNSVKRKVNRQASDSISEETLSAIVIMVIDSLMQSFDKAMESIRNRSEYLSQRGYDVPTLREVLFCEGENDGIEINDTHDSIALMLHGGKCPVKKNRKPSPDVMQNLLYGKQKRKRRGFRPVQGADIVLSTVGGKSNSHMQTPIAMDKMLFGGNETNTPCMLVAYASRMASTVVHSAIDHISNTHKIVEISTLSLKNEVKDLVKSGLLVLDEDALSVCSEDFTCGDDEEVVKEESFTESNEESILVISVKPKSNFILE